MGLSIWIPAGIFNFSIGSLNIFVENGLPVVYRGAIFDFTTLGPCRGFITAALIMILSFLVLIFEFSGIIF
jgi:hypothetical protein